MQNMNPRLFLGANSADGFVSYFAESYANDPKAKVYLIKGGPGTGKSTFMKKVAAEAQKRLIPAVFCPCSSDPLSLDGVILPTMHVTVLDATAPHTLDPVYPGAVETILNFGDFWAEEELRKNRGEIVRLTDENKVHHHKASQALAAVGRLMRDDMRISLLAADIEKTVDFAEKTANRLLVPTENIPREHTALIGAVTPCGQVQYDTTLHGLAKRVIRVYDPYGTVSNILFSIVRDIALARGYEIITLRNPLLPREKIDHLIIPAANLAFSVAENEQSRLPNERFIRFERFSDGLILHANRKRLALNRRLHDGLCDTAVRNLKNAKDIHDELESFYSRTVDYGKLNHFTDDFLKKLFGE